MRVGTSSLEVRAQETREIWHPVKDRNCFVTHLMNTRGQQKLTSPAEMNKQDTFSHPLCKQLSGMIDLRTLNPPEWCNDSPERRASAAACSKAYVTLDNGVLPCEPDTERGKCKYPEKTVDPIPC